MPFSLDSIGIGGFSHDFGSLNGKSSTVVAAFQAFGIRKPTFMMIVTFLLSQIFPSSLDIPGQQRTSLNNLATAVRGIADNILERARDDNVNTAGGGVDRSIIGALGMSPHVLTRL